MRLVLRLVLTVGALGFTIQSASAQVTSLSGTTANESRTVFDSISEDTLREAVRRNGSGDATETTQKAVPNVGSFATGRIRSTDHDGLDYSGPAAAGGKSVGASSEEKSLFAGFAYRPTGLQSGHRASIGAFLGYTDLEVDLGPATGLFNLTAPNVGSSTSRALFGGLTGVYSIGNLYFAGTGAIFAGEGDINQRVGNFTPYNPKFDTEGYFAQAAVGYSHQVAQVGGARIFLTGEGGFRRVDFETEKFASQTGVNQFKLLSQSSSVVGSVGLFSVSTFGSMSVRPFARLGVVHDLMANSQEETYNGAGNLTEEANFSADKTKGTGELGFTVVQGGWNFTAAGFTEWAGDHETLGAKLGARYDF